VKALISIKRDTERGIGFAHLASCRRFATRSLDETTSFDPDGIAAASGHDHAKRQGRDNDAQGYKQEASVLSHILPVARGLARRPFFRESNKYSTMTNAIILCAGLGTRLRPLTNELPKPLVWIGDRPAIAHIVEKLVQGGVDHVVINTHHLAEKFDTKLIASLPVPVDVVHEPHILGTAGGVAGAADALGSGDVIVWNGDILADVDIAELRRSYESEASQGAIAVLVVLPRHAQEARIGEGTVGLDDHGDVVRLRSEVFGEEKRSADYVGVQMIGASLRSRLPAEGCFMADVYLPALRRGERIATTPAVTRFTDLGTVESYLEENLRWLRASNMPSYAGDGSVVQNGVDVMDSVLGECSTVLGHGVLSEVVVWPGATVTAPIDRAIVMRSGEIVHV
jgi:mannose-1-phosphate guanylyltransferase